MSARYWRSGTLVNDKVTEDNSADIKTAVEATQTSVEALDDAIVDVSGVKMQRVSIENITKKLPVDIQNIQPYYDQHLSLDGDAAAAEDRRGELDKGGRLGYGWNCVQDTTAVVWTREGSHDGTNWSTLETTGASLTYTSADVIKYSQYRYIRITAAKSGNPGDLVNIDIGAGL